MAIGYTCVQKCGHDIFCDGNVGKQPANSLLYSIIITIMHGN